MVVPPIVLIITILEFSLMQIKAASDESSLLPDQILSACTGPGVNRNETGGCYIDSSVENYPNKCFGEYVILKYLKHVLKFHSTDEKLVSDIDGHFRTLPMYEVSILNSDLNLMTNKSPKIHCQNRLETAQVGVNKNFFLQLFYERKYS